MRSILALFIFAIALLTLPAHQASAAGRYYYYVVKPGDTLESITSKMLNGSTLYGTDGGRARVLALNPALARGKRLRVGQRVWLPILRSGSEVEPLKPVPPVAKPPAPPVRKIASTPTEPEFEQYSALTLAPEVFYMRLDATERPGGGNAILFSDLAYALNLSWDQYWSESFKSWGRLRVSQVTIVESLEKRIDNRSQFYSGFFVGGAARLGRRGLSLLGAELGHDQQMTYRSLNSQAVTLEKTWTPQASILVRAHLTDQTAPLGFGFELKATAFAPAKSSSSSSSVGGGALGKIYISHAPKTGPNLELGLSYSRTRFTTEHAAHSRTDVNFSFGITWEVGK